MAKIDKKTLKQIEYHLAAKNYVDMFSSSMMDYG